MQHSITSDVKSSPVVSTQQSIVIQIFGAVILGFALLYGVGFTSMHVAHNAAHDTRHAIALPCH